jgi:glycosyltransferase involved in cell wall biosynthesis
VRALVVTTVHRADDPRVRERTIGTLALGMSVRYAAREPAPSRRDDHEWVPLPGGRVRRWWGALREMLRRDVDVVSLHDPELIPAGLITRLIRKVPVVVDVHEDVPAQIRHKSWVPAPLRGPAAWTAHRFLRMAERWCVVTLAEPGYRRLFRFEHPVFVNYPAAGSLPDPGCDAGYAVYVGDVTEQRGALAMVDAVASADPPLRLEVVGRVDDDLARRMMERAAGTGVDLTLTGPLPHRAAMEVVAGASVGLSLLADVPNYRWSMPTKVIEYLAMGVPVVASDLPGTRAALAGLEAVTLVLPGDAAAAAGAVAGAAADRARAQAQAPQVRESRVWPADRVLDLYRTVACS